MVKIEAVAKLRVFEPVLRQMGAEALFLFGSTARGDARQDSDVDVLVDLRSDSEFTLLDIAAVRRLLSEGIHSSVDLTILDDLSAPTRDAILAEAVQVF